MNEINSGFFTIATSYRLPWVRVLARALKRMHPSIPVFLLLADRVDGRYDPASEPFITIPLETLENIPQREDMLFRYTAKELTCALKPYGFDHLFSQYGVSSVIYFDPDILPTGSLDELWTLLHTESIVLTPHILQPCPDEFVLQEVNLHLAGIFNTGFIGVSHTEEGLRFIDWWKRRLYAHCVTDVKQGLFFDQKWIDFVPAFFDRIHVCRSPKWNIGYWNLASRAAHLHFEHGDLCYGGVSAGFFNFSGFDVHHLGTLSVHQNRLTLSEMPHLRPLFEQYRTLLIEEGYETARHWSYAFDLFDNGVPIPPVARRIFWGLSGREFFGNPFAAESFGSFYSWLRMDFEDSPNSQSLPISNLLMHLHAKSPSVQKLFPDPKRRNLGHFKAWVQTPAAANLRIHPVFVRTEQSPDFASRATASLQGVAADGEKADFGVNISGYVTRQTGLGEVARSNIQALSSIAVPHVINDFRIMSLPRYRGRRMEFTDKNPYLINLMHINADAFMYFRRFVGPRYFERRYNIALWWWELDDFPKQWHGCFDFLQEIWTQSRYCQSVFQRVSPVPVRRLPHVVDLDTSAVEFCPHRFGIPEGVFSFLFSFSFFSVLQRKNPAGLIEAYRRAFANNPRTLLIIKSTGSRHHADQLAQLKAMAAGLNVRFIDESLPLQEILNLMASVDCYVSLHRSEGFGRGMAEAMLLGKPVIATAYSGNLDFMTEENSFLVDYRLVELQEDIEPYKKGNQWAEPDIDQAAQLMRLVYEDRDLAQRRAACAAADIRKNHSSEVAGLAMAERLRQIGADSSP
jgi:glycosyltransferase involved in cell wall biosynthesis